MKKFWKATILLSLMMILFAFSASGAAPQKELIQMAILLDTSDSMDGLIDQARSQIWRIVNELTLAKKTGKTPQLEVALYEYGKDSIPSQEGYLRMILPLTTDLDKISEELFKLDTYGGDEYCGRVIKSSVEGLQWSKSNNDYKVIVIAGNEPFTQGEVKYEKSCQAAVAKGIVVNTIFCGNNQEGIATGWKNGADLADGTYINIDQNQKTVQINAPQDEEIVKLGQELNKTYIPYGFHGEENKARQEKEDANASTMGSESIVQRSVAKGSGFYTNTGWDLVDAAKKDEKILDNLKDNELPSEMRKMSKEEKKKYVEEKSKKRAGIQAKLNQLNQERRLYVEKAMKNQSGENSFDTAIIKAIRAQAVKKNFKFN